MILQSLTSYYEVLGSKGEVARLGWTSERISYALNIDDDGNLISILPLKEQSEDGKKMNPRRMYVPFHAKKSSNVRASFVCDNETYLLGIDNAGKPDRAEKCFEASKELHIKLLEKSESKFARAICGFFKNWDTSSAKQHPGIEEYKADLDKGENLIFINNGVFASQDEGISQAWQEYYNGDEIGEKMRCLITGSLAVPQAVHPSIKGVLGAQSSGAALVSFNKPSFCSYEREQNLNAPVGKYASFAYTTALNHLISDKRHKINLGDMTVVYWADDAGRQYQDAFSALLDGDNDSISGEDLDSFMNKISEGKPANWDELTIDPENNFYILGLSPNNSRLSVRFFLRDSFGKMVRHMKEHYERLKIIKDNRSKQEDIPLWKLLRETINEKSSDKSPIPQMTGDTLRAIITGGRYPATLYQQTQLRIRAERSVTRGRAAIIKAYLLRNASEENSNYKEVLTVELNENTKYQPYVLGRLFSLLEHVQKNANPSINTTIKDKYFTSACATPAIVFPVLLNLSEKHLKKLTERSRIYYAKQIGQLISLINESYPQHHSLYDQGIFQLGYYHQTQKNFQKKEDGSKEEQSMEEVVENE